MRHELGQTRQQGYRLIQAHDIMVELLEAGVPHEELPETERMNRELRKVKPEHRPIVWRALVRAAREADSDDGRPTIQDVRTAARRLETTSETRRREQGEVLAHFERTSNVLRSNIAFDMLDETVRQRLALVLAEIAESVQRLIRALERANDDE